jgi:hypothetical protein
MALLPYLAANTSVTKINLDGNAISDAGAVALADALKTNTSIVSPRDRQDLVECQLDWV